jgi:hypothetical protein
MYRGRSESRPLSCQCRGAFPVQKHREGLVGRSRSEAALSLLSDFLQLRLFLKDGDPAEAVLLRKGARRLGSSGKTIGAWSPSFPFRSSEVAKIPPVRHKCLNGKKIRFEPCSAYLVKMAKKFNRCSRDAFQATPLRPFLAPRNYPVNARRGGGRVTPSHLSVTRFIRQRRRTTNSSRK